MPKYAPLWLAVHAQTLMTPWSLAHAQGPAQAKAPAPAQSIPAASAPATPSVASIESELQTGTKRPAALVPVFRDLAIAKANAGDAEGSRRAFTALLALDPTFRLAKEEPDLVRSPYLEARGFWESQSLPFGATGELDDAKSLLVVRIVDPGNLGSRVRIRVKQPDGTRFSETVLPLEPTQRVTLKRTPGSTEDVAYNLAILDEHGNRLLESGTDQAPIVIAAKKPLPAPVVIAQPKLPAPAKIAPRTVIAGLSFSVAAGAVLGGVIATLKREDLADSWNSGDCSGEGLTRGERCKNEHDRIGVMEKVAGGLYGVGAVALVGGVVALLLPHKHHEQQKSATSPQVSLACSSGPALLGLSCSARY